MIFVVESWLDDRTLDAQICPKGYNIIRKDRKSKTLTRGGGVLLLFKNNVHLVDKTNAGDDFEHLCVDIFTPQSQNASHRFVCYYNPPGQSKDRILQLCNSVENYLQPSPVFIVGDFNLPSINWKISSTSSSSQQQFLDLCIESSLMQHITEPTHISGSTLDLVLTNFTARDLLIKCQTLAPFTSSCDHNFISFLCSDLMSKPEDDGRTFYCYHKGNYDAINNSLAAISWDRVFTDCENDVQLVYDSFLDIVHSLMEANIPKNPATVKVKHNRNLRMLATKKAKLYKRCKVDTTLKPSYKTASLEYDNAVREFYDKIENNICNSRSDSAFYKYANKSFKVKRSIPTIISDDGKMLLDNLSKADHFNETFQSVFTRDNGVPITTSQKTKSFMNEICITSQKVEIALQRMSPKTSATPDGIPPIVLKKIGPTILYFLTTFFQLSISTATVPRQWKTANVIPIHKKSSKENATNYRPISLTSSVCRLLEAVVKDEVLQHLMSNNLISRSQQGFLPRRGTATQLLQTLNDWTTAFDNKNPVDVIYTDFSKAFDRVSHAKLSQTLFSFGIGGVNLRWITEFLTGRTQRVEVNGVFSSPLDVISGVPQGSVLGPLLFIIYIEDIQYCCQQHCKIGLYADDSKLYSQQPQMLQNTLHSLDEFIEDRQLRLALEKCQHLTIARKSSDQQFFLEGCAISQSDVVTDLGIRICSTLQWDQHIIHLRKKSIARCYQLLHSFRSKNIWTYKKAFVTYVRPVLEANTVVWCPYLKKDVIAVEKVQEKFLKAICRRCNVRTRTYYERLNALDIETLEYRRHKFDVIMVFKIIHELVDVDFNDFFSFSNTPYNLRRHRFHIEGVKCNSDTRKYYFANRIIFQIRFQQNYQTTILYDFYC